MKAHGTDVDIDLADRELLLKLIDHVPAMQKDSRGQPTKHKTGVYFHDAPINPFTGVCTLDYKQAEETGYFKIDILNVNMYKDVKDPEHLDKLSAQEPLWELLIQDDFVDLLFHLNGHGDILRKTRPTSIEQLAAVLAMIRPAKRYLIGKPWNMVMKEVWIKPSNSEYYWKKSHSFAYALAVIVQMNLICENLTKEKNIV